MKQIVIAKQEPRIASQLIEVPVTVNNQGSITFPDIQQLRSTPDCVIVIKSMRLITDKVLTNAPLSGYATAPLSELKKMSLIIYSEGWEKAQYVPILTLNDMVDADSDDATTIPYKNSKFELDDWRRVDWTKTKIQFSNTTSSQGAPYTVLIDVEYLRLNAQGQIIEGSM